MNLQTKRTEYKKAIYQFGENFVYRLMRPWLRIPFISKMSSVSKETDRAVKIFHDFSTGVIEETGKSFKNFKDSTNTGKRMSLIDLLLTRADEVGDIDNDGIREEIDTFMFDVRLIGTRTK